ncbi:MAG TPA: hypothetical protein VIL00_03210 [Pseudonocardiaceae bacterium]
MGRAQVVEKRSGRLRNWLRRLAHRRSRVPAGRAPGRIPPGWGDDEGGAGVREPRRPEPGPLAGGGAGLPPKPPIQIHLPDARR